MCRHVGLEPYLFNGALTRKAHDLLLLLVEHIRNITDAFMNVI